ncbi:hypothetical protein CJU89_5596 [Yarrowia sp. B02]|nr:hypothetical protein CJU89_5596 [Yarrowia sp. B02]
MNSRYHPGYLSNFQTPTKIPASVPLPKQEPPLSFHTQDPEGVKYFKESKSPIVKQLEKNRQLFHKSHLTPTGYLDIVIRLLREMDDALHRRASALVRYLPAEVLNKLQSKEPTNVFNKFVCYFQAHDWTALMKMLQSEKEYLLYNPSTSWEHTNNENVYYTETTLVPTPDLDVKPPVGSLSETQTPVRRRKRSRQPSPELQVCPSLMGL